jgi:carboxyl-terminal processing protease
VKPESAAYRAGLRRGFVILEIDQTRAEALISRASRADQSQAMIRLLATRALTSRLEGKTDSTVRLVYLDANDRRRETVVRREPPGGEVSEAFGNFPAQRTFFEARRLEGGAGYVRFNIFVMSLMEKIRSAIRSMKDAPGIIIDLRGNPGGIGAMAGGIASEMESRQLSLGTMKMRAGHVNFAVFPPKNPFAGKVAILIDGGSASTSEIFAAGMQELGRAVVIGERSAGAALPSIITKLPTGALFQFAIGDFRTPKGTLIEGRGVVPDVEVRLSRRELLRGRDSQLDAALKAIQKSASGKPIRQTSSARPNTGKIIRGKS